MQYHQDVEDSDFLALPRTLLAREVTQLLADGENPSITNHSIRSYLFARLVAEQRGLKAARDYNTELLFCACALHDIGLTKVGDRMQRFEVDGADVAAELLSRHGVEAGEIDLVWQAIALNTSPGIVERRGILCALTLAGVAVDIGGDAPFISESVAGRIHRAYPRLSIARVLSDTVVGQAQRSPEKAPLFSMPLQMMQQRLSAAHVTEVERLAAAGRWRE
jgi:hypothetical protein